MKRLFLICLTVVSAQLIHLTNSLARSASGHARSSAAQELDFRGQYNLVDGPGFFSDSGVEFPSFSEIQNRLALLAKTYPAYASVVVYGKSKGNQNLTLIRIADSSVPADHAPRMAVEISGAIHGNEYLGIEDRLAAHFLEHLEEMKGLKAFLSQGGVIYLIPIVNPDGFESRRRLNLNAIDLNRDFDMLTTGEKRFTQPESTSLAQYLENDLSAHQLQLKLSLDYHCCTPAMITPWAYIDAQPKVEDQPAFDAIRSLEKATLGFPTGNPTQTVGYEAEGSTIDYFYAKWGTLALAVEGRDGGEEAYFNDHVRFWESLFENLASSKLTTNRRAVCL